MKPAGGGSGGIPDQDELLTLGKIRNLIPLAKITTSLTKERTGPENFSGRGAGLLFKN